MSLKKCNMIELFSLIYWDHFIGGVLFINCINKSSHFGYVGAFGLILIMGGFLSIASFARRPLHISFKLYLFIGSYLLEF